MRFHTDEHFNIGHEHVTGGKPCQDHALSGVHEGAAYAVVSDGCSSGGHTDIGARLMSLSAAAAIREHWSSTQNAVALSAPQDVVLRQRLILGGIKETLRLESDDMLATCAYVYLSPEGGFIHLRGDGVIALVYDDGIVLRRYDWPNNTPFYPAYVENTLPVFVSAHGGDINARVLTEKTFTNRAGAQLLPEANRNFSIADGIRGVTIPVSKDELANRLAYVAVFSDGVCRVENMDWQDAARELLAFKSAEGVFAKRRMMRFMKDTRAVGKGPLDDIAYAVIRIDRSDEVIQTEGKTDGS